MIKNVVQIFHKFAPLFLGAFVRAHLFQHSTVTEQNGQTTAHEYISRVTQETMSVAVVFDPTCETQGNATTWIEQEKLLFWPTHSHGDDVEPE